MYSQSDVEHYSTPQLFGRLILIYTEYVDHRAKAKISQVHVTFARLFLRIDLISMTKTLKYDARKLKSTKPAHKMLLTVKK